MKTVGGSRSPVLPKPAATSNDQGVSGRGRTTNVNKSRRPLDDIAHARRPNHLAVARPNFFHMMAECSLDEIEFISFLNHERLTGPTRTLPRPDIAGPEHRSPRTERNLPLDPQF